MSCNSEPEPINEFDQQECIEFFLDSYEMIAHDSQSIPCGKNYIVLFSNENTYFTVLNNDCADLQPHRIEDCEGNILCEFTNEDGCFEMIQKSNRIGIIGVSP